MPSMKVKCNVGVSFVLATISAGLAGEAFIRL